MATGIKKGHVPEELSYLRWAAWGAIDIETMQKEPRRNYIKAVRAELASRGYKLECGGTFNRPFYRIFDARSLATKGNAWITTSAVEGAFAAVCKAFLNKEDPEHAAATADAGRAVAG